MGQGVDILNPKTFAGREYNSWKEQTLRNSWYVINRVAEQPQGSFKTKTVSLSVDNGFPHCGRSTFFIKNVIHCNENAQIFFLFSVPAPKNIIPKFSVEECGRNSLRCSSTDQQSMPRNTLELVVAHRALAPWLTLLRCSSFLATPLSCPSSLLSCSPAPCIFLTAGPVKIEPRVFLLRHV